MQHLIKYYLLVALIAFGCVAVTVHYAHSQEEGSLTYKDGVATWRGLVTEKRLQRLVRMSYYGLHTLNIHSDGGEATAGFGLGALAQVKKIKVVVDRGNWCVSACAFAAAGAPELVLNGTLAFHNIWYDTSYKLSQIELYNGALLMGTFLENYLLRVGFSHHFSSLLFDETDQDTYYVFTSVRDLNKVRINYRFNKSLKFMLTETRLGYYREILRRHRATGNDIFEYANSQRAQSINDRDKAGDSLSSDTVPVLKPVPVPVFRPKN